MSTTNIEARQADTAVGAQANTGTRVVGTFPGEVFLLRFGTNL